LSSKQKGPWPSHSAYRSFPRNHDSAPNTTNDPGLPLLDGHLQVTFSKLYGVSPEEQAKVFWKQVSAGLLMIL
jgi:hypothetical protein